MDAIATKRQNTSNFCSMSYLPRTAPGEAREGVRREAFGPEERVRARPQALYVEARVREAVKAILEEVLLEEEMTEHTWKVAIGNSPPPGEVSATVTTSAAFS
jgi:hypothetical protein